MQLTLKFLTQRQPATPLDRLEPGQRVKVVQTLAGIIVKPASRTGPPIVPDVATTSPIRETQND